MGRTLVSHTRRAFSSLVFTIGSHDSSNPRGIDRLSAVKPLILAIYNHHPVLCMQTPYLDTIPYHTIRDTALAVPYLRGDWLKSRSFSRIPYRILYRNTKFQCVRGELPRHLQASYTRLLPSTDLLFSSYFVSYSFLSQYRLLKETIISSPIETIRIETNDCFLHTLLTLFVDIRRTTTILDIAAARHT